MAAFACLVRDAPLLMGDSGLAPAREVLAAAAAKGLGPFELPTLHWWLPTGDGTLRALAVLGVLVSALVAVPRLSSIAAPVAAALYLSFATAGSTFFSFQWDALIVESLLLCSLLGDSPSRPAVLALYLLNAKLYLESGLAKLGWSDDWTSLEAMGRYWMTAPLPTPLAWFADALPSPIQRALTAATLAGELGLPLLLVLGRVGRIAFAVAGSALQLGILATANYGSFNWLALALHCGLLVEGAGWRKRDLVLGATWLWLSIVVFLSRFAGGDFELASTVQRWRVANAYHLFASIDPRRVEIEVLGSDDGRAWTALPVRWRPPDSGFLAPYHPRVAFSSWFLALGPGRGEIDFSFYAPPWLARLVDLWCEDPARLRSILSADVASPRLVTLGAWDAGFGETPGSWTRREIGRHPHVHACGDGRARFPPATRFAAADAVSPEGG